MWAQSRLVADQFLVFFLFIFSVSIVLNYYFRQDYLSAKMRQSKIDSQKWPYLHLYKEDKSHKFWATRKKISIKIIIDFLTSSWWVNWFSHKLILPLSFPWFTFTKLILIYRLNVTYRRLSHYWLLYFDFGSHARQ